MRILTLLVFFPLGLWAEQSFLLSPGVLSESGSQSISAKTACSYCLNPNLASSDLVSMHTRYINQRSIDIELALQASINNTAQNTKNFQAELEHKTPVSHSKLNVQALDAGEYENAQGMEVGDSFQSQGVLAQSHLDIGKYSQLDVYAQFRGLSDEVSDRARLNTANASNYNLLINYDVANLGPLENLHTQLYAANVQQDQNYPDHWSSSSFSDQTVEYKESQIELSLENSLFLGYLKLASGINLGSHTSAGKNAPDDYFLPSTRDNHIGAFVTSVIGLGDDKSVSLRLNWKYLDREIDNKTLQSWQPGSTFNRLENQFGINLNWDHRISKTEEIQLGLASQNEAPQAAQQFIWVLPAFSSIIFEGNPGLKLIRHNQLEASIRSDRGFSARLLLDYIKGYVTLDYYSATPLNDRLRFRNVDVLSGQAEVSAFKQMGLWLGEAELKIKNMQNLTDNKTEKGVSPYQARVRLTYQESDHQFKLQWTYVAEPEEQLQDASGQDIFNNGLSGDYLLTKLSAGLSVNDWWLEASMDNVFDVEYSPYTNNQYLANLTVPGSQYLGQGRNIQLSARYEF